MGSGEESSPEEGEAGEVHPIPLPEVDQSLMPVRYDPFEDFEDADLAVAFGYANR
jgi:hypothetical protein